MKLNKLTKAIAAVALTGSLATVSQQALAFNDYYYNYATTKISNVASQRNFVNVVTAAMERRVAVYQNIVNKYGHYSWAKRYVDQLNAFKVQLQRWSDLKNSLNGGVQVVSTDVTTSNYEQVKRQEEQLTNVAERSFEESDDDFVYVYKEVIRTYTTPVITKTYLMTHTTKHYSDGTKNTTTKAKLTSNVVTHETRSEVDKTLINQYAKVIAPVLTEGEMGTPTESVLTEEQYLAREDVNYAGTDAYYEAALNLYSGFSRNSIDTYWAPYAQNLEQIGAPAAWSRGWTGKGSTIAILDTGIDLDHSEFEGRIVDTACLSWYACDYKDETVDDINNVSHGTHVAGIAAAALDGMGMTGVAPDANLMIGKVSIGKYGAIDLRAVAKGLAWAAEGGAVVANVSANYNVDYTYKNSLVEIEDGLYRSTDTRKWMSDGSTYADSGYSHFLKRSYVQDMQDAMTDNELVLVASAGNQGLDISTFPAHLAVLENEDGSLAMGGRVIVAGNYDPSSSDSMAYSSNAAGTVCFDYNASQNTCESDRRVSDFYLMAPGQYVMSTVDGNDYMTLSGTSMAAPTISGAVAVVHQMWPHMTGENLVKLLLDTGNTEDIKNYDESVHGQGLLDLDEATLPQGALGIPTTGRVDGTTTSIEGNQTLSLAGASVSALDELMVIDDYDRDFYLDANELNMNADTRTVHITKATQNGYDINEYAGYANGIPMDFGKLSTTFSEDGGDFTFTYDLTDNVAFGVVRENETFLGNLADGALMDINGATTLYFGYEAEQEVAKGVTVFGAATFGVTDLNVNSDAMMKDASTALSNSARVGAKFTNGKSTFGLVAALPVAITSADATFETAAGVSVSGDIMTETVTSSLANDAREYSVGAFYNTALTNHVDMGLFVEARNNYAGTNGTVNTEYGFKLSGRF